VMVNVVKNGWIERTLFHPWVIAARRATAT
jgi:hypothetical protein